MTYTPNVPQANQTIASTTTPIRQNFQFIETDLQVEHSFNGNSAAAEGTHLKASMPNQADPGSLPAGTNGQYYVGSAKPKFYDGTTARFLQMATLEENISTGTVALTTSNTVFFTAPANSSGCYFLVPPSGIDASDASAMGQFVSGDTDVNSGHLSDPGITISDSGLDIRAATTSGSLNGNYKYVVVYYTP